ncbi:hypothetical protein GALMADRAFT_222940 [Galerina marginata CBS 339.88]|uniref:Uncharacterized protein n=1 Tax=Galerina marginata (strain CBS 339.88) TaxID=685588 RepID=A0A067TM55_GALM3|nr:hypothetical protein GALMADRAFT_222940 [Galerina marginata CBS 339.88]
MALQQHEAQNEEEKIGDFGSTTPAMYALVPPSDEAQPKKPMMRRRRRISPRVFIPTAVIIIQSALLAFGWIFFGITISRPVPLPPLLASKIRNHNQSLTMVVTLISSFIAAVSSFLFTRAIRWSLARSLARPVSLYKVAATIRLATGSPIRDPSRLEWSIAAAVCLLALNAQTAGWTTLLMPKPITMEARISGFELDVNSPDFQQLMLTNGQIVTPDLFTSVIPLVEASGATAVSTHFALPSILNFNQISYINSTNGILPTNIGEMYSVLRSATGNSLPVNTNVEDLLSRPAGFPVSFTMTQQGFTANVSCSQRPMNQTTVPSMQILSATQTVFNSPLTLAQLVVQCPNSAAATVSRPVMTSSNVDAVFGISCPVTDDNGKKTWNFIITGSGIYKFINTTVCNISPQLTTLHVDYSDATKFFNSSFPSFVNGSQPWDVIDAPWVGEYALSILLRGLNVGQSTTGNSVGDTLSSFVAIIPPYADALNDVLESYVRGVMEFSVTLLRTAYTQNDNGLFLGNRSVIPPSMRTSTNGTFRAETIGWHQDHDTAPGVLLAPSLVLVVSLLIVGITFLKTKDFNEPEGNHHFDPGNILHVIAASSAGGLKERFPTFDENPIAYSSGVDITLGPLDGPGGERLGFIHAK